MTRRPRPLALLTALFICAALHSVARAQSEDEQGVRLEGPEVVKLDWDTRSIVAHDLDGDGRNDLAVLNNDRARIDLLYQQAPGDAAGRRKRRARVKRWQPVLEDARFRREAIVTGSKMFALAVGDLDGDGLSDLAFTGDPGGLTIVYQGPRDEWERRREFDTERPTQWPSALSITDLDLDGSNELVMLASNQLLILDSPDQGGELEQRRFPVAERNCYGLVVSDLNSDGLPDLMYLAQQSSHSWRARLQRPDGELGPERAFPLETPRRGLVPFLAKRGQPHSYAGVQSRSGIIEVLDIEAGGAGSNRTVSLSPHVYGTPAKDSAAESYAFGDFDADGRTDLAVADWKGAEVWLYIQREDATFAEPVAFPSLSDLRSLAAGDVDGDGAAELFVVSREEETIGVSRYTRAGRLEYPRPVALEGTPLVAEVLDHDRDGVDELVCLVRREGQRGAAVLDFDKPSGEWRETTYAELEGLKTDPRAVKVLDADRNGWDDLAVFIAQSPMRLLLHQDNGSYQDASRSEGFRSGLVDKLLPAQLGTGDLDGDGHSEILVAGKGFARVLEIDEAGNLSVRDQFNARDREGDVAAVLPADLDVDGVPEIVLSVDDGSRFETLRRDRKGVYRLQRFLEPGSIDIVDTRVMDIDGDGRDELLYLGKDRFWVVPVGPDDLTVRSVASHEAEWEDVVYSRLAAADLDGDGLDELLALDSRSSRVLEVLSWNGKKEWTSELRFRIFDADPHYRGRTGSSSEPRELVVEDVTSDGRPDLVLLAHDRVLVYPSSPSARAATPARDTSSPSAGN